MAELHAFDANQVEPTTPFEAIPAGRYVAAITASEMRPTKAGTGNFLQFSFEILEGAYKGRMLWARLNLDNPNPKTVEIARAELSAICRAVGVMTPADSCELHNLPLLVHVKVKRRTDTDELQNEIRGYSKREDSSAQPPQAVTNTPPWRR